MGSQGLKRTKWKNEYTQRRRLRRNKFTSKGEVFPTWALLPNLKEIKRLAFQKCKLQNSFFKLHLQKCVFPNFNLRTLSSKSNLRSSFANLFNFKFSKTCWKSPKLYKRSLTHFQKMSLARWFWASFFLKKKCFDSWNGLKQTLFFDRQDEGW